MHNVHESYTHMHTHMYTYMYALLLQHTYTDTQIHTNKSIPEISLQLKKENDWRNPSIYK